MNEKDFNKLNKVQILELFLEEKEDNRKLRERIEELELELERKNIEITTAGSIAEASLKINHVFEDADRAAEQYLMSIRELGQQMLELYKRKPGKKE